MRSVRCDACGTKALMAASQCPKCGHLFDMRDGFGEMLPLAYCPACDSYYPEKLGSCRWCGTKPEPAPITPRILKGVGIAAFGAVLMVGWVLRDKPPRYSAVVQDTTQREPLPVATPAPTTLPAATPPSTDSTSSRVQLAAGEAMSAEQPQTPAPTPTAATRVASVEAIAPPAAPAGSSSAATKPPARQPQPTTAKTTASASKTRSASRWVNSVSKGWVVVRAAPSKDSRLIASIGPNARVQLGEWRGEWRRIKAKGIAGWVEPRSSFAVVPSPRARAVVSR